MIRRLSGQYRLFRTLVALAAVVGITSTGTPLLAVASRGPQAPAAAPVTSSAQKMSAADIAKLRQQLTINRESANPRVAEGAKRALLWLDILSASSPSERHAAIRKLPVTIVRSTPTDGRVGTVKTYVTRGRSVVQVFVPSAITERAVEEDLSDSAGSGPLVLPSSTGRWKSGGDSSCYWDPEDNGPDQCYPSQGRWKSDGQGGCYWDGNDSGPGQCDPPQTLCYTDDEWGTCATEQEIDDALIVLAEQEAEQDQLQAEYDAAQAQKAAWCATHSCDDLEELVDAVPSGPSLDWLETERFDDCVSDSILAMGELAGAVYHRTQALGKIAAHVNGIARLTAFGLSAKVLIVIGGTLVAGAAIYVMANCIETYFMEHHLVAAGPRPRWSAGV